MRGLKNVPIFGGVVVLKCDAELLLEGAASMALEKEQRAETKREAGILKRWEGIVRSAVSRELLRDKYGH